MRHYKTYILHAALGLIMVGCTSNSFDSASINDDTSENPDGFATGTLSSTIGEVPESCGAVVMTEDDEIVDEGSTDSEANNYELTVFANEPVKFYVGNMAIPDRDGHPRHVKNVDGENWFYISNPINALLAPGETVHNSAAMHRQYQGTARCVKNSWSWDEDMPDHKGVQGEDNIQRDPIDLYVKGEATYTDPDSGEVKTGVRINTDETAGNLGGSGSGGTWLIVNDRIYFQAREGDPIITRVAASKLGATTFSFATEIEGIGVEEVACTVN